MSLIEVSSYIMNVSQMDSYFFATHELLKLFYWFSKSASITNSEGKLRKIRQEVLGKANVMNEFKLASQSVQSYEDLHMRPLL